LISKKFVLLIGENAEIIVAHNEQEVMTAVPNVDIIFGRITKEIFAATTK